MSVNDRVVHLPSGLRGFVVDVDLADGMVKVVYDCNPAEWDGSWWFEEDFRVEGWN